MSVTIKVCQGRSCAAHSSIYLVDRAKAELDNNKSIKVETCGCLDHCKQAPNVAVETDNSKTVHSHMTGPKMGDLITHLGKK